VTRSLWQRWFSSSRHLAFSRRRTELKGRGELPALEFLEDRLAPSANWNNFGGNAQHTDIASVPAQPIDQLLWSTPLDLNPWGAVHYGDPVFTGNNTVIVPIKVTWDGTTQGATNFYEEGINDVTGAVLWSTAPTGSITAASNTSPIVITSPNNGLSTGDVVTIGGVLGNTAVNATYSNPTWTITVLTPNTFSLNGSMGNGTYTGGGTWEFTTASSSSTSYIEPQYNWLPPNQAVYDPVTNRAYFPGPGGTIDYISNPDTSRGVVTPVQEAFYGTSNYTANESAYNSSIYINTPLTVDTLGNVYFGYEVTGSNPSGITEGGIARISASGAVAYELAFAAAASDGQTPTDDGNWTAAMGSAPALSNNGSVLYLGVDDGGYSLSGGEYNSYLVGLNSTTLAPVYSVRLLDPTSGSGVPSSGVQTTGNGAGVIDVSSASPMVAPDGSVFFGVFGSNYNGSRGFLLHFAGNLATEYTPGAFGWDDTASIIPTSMVPSYTGTSSYLILSKYNNYANAEVGEPYGGNGVDQIAILDPYATQPDPNYDPQPNGQVMPVMKEIMTYASPSPDLNNVNGGDPNAVREWCTNGTAVDPATDSVFVNNEDGYTYEWNLGTGTITNAVEITLGYGVPYTPTALSPNGEAFSDNGGTLFALGGYSNYTINTVPSADPAVVGNPITFTTTLASTSGGPTPTGSITYSYTSGANNPMNTPGSIVILGTVPLVNGVASYTATGLPAAHYHVVASYSGDSNYAVGQTTLVQPILANTTTSVTSSANPSNFGSSVTFTATVTPTSTSFVPLGTVTFMDGSTVLGTASLNSLETGPYSLAYNQATFTTSSLPVGSDAITAVYNGDQNFEGSTSSALIQTVTFQPATISGEVFNDLNGNGVKDAGEPGLQGWTVELLSSDGTILNTTLSDTNGNYSFTVVNPGPFTIKEVPQSGWFITLPAGGGTYTLTPASGATIANENFGDFQSATITGEVFNDLNGDGLLDNGEPGLQGWTVNLFDSTGKLLSSVITDANGNYVLTGGGPGTLTVSEVVPAGWVQTLPTSPASYSVDVSSGGLLITGRNFGDFQQTTISGELFVDLNDTGTMTAGDPGLSGWTVELLNASTSALLATQTTSANGSYTFDVGPGSFRVREVVPAGWIQTTTNPADILVNSGSPSTGVNFGNFQLGVISGQTFQDFNGNGIQDVNDTALSGWTIQLLNPVTLSVLNSQTTGANGTFSLVASGPGTYLVREVLQSGWVQTTTNPAAIVITTSGTVVSGQNFGDFQLVAIGGQVFLDNNGDGSENGADSGLQGWTIQLKNAGTGALIASQTSDATGNYTFSNLGPGSYTVREVLHSGWLQTTANPANITTSSGGTTTGVNFGDFQLGVISGEIFQDTKGSGVLTSGDSGLPGWTVQLLDATQGTILQTRITDGSGNYQFSSIGPGTYKVREVAQAGWAQTTANPANGTISSGATITGQNFGDFQLISIGGRVFVDTTADGIDSPSKPGFNGFTVQLYRDVAGTGRLVQGADPLVASTVSTTINGQAGEYVFNGIGPGNYLVFEVKQSGLLQTAPAPLGAYSVVSLSGTNVFSNDFGNLGSPGQSFVYQLYLDMLHRRVDPTGMLYFSGALAQGASRAQVVEGIESSQEYRTDEVNSLYQAYLGRNVDPTGLGSALALLSSTPFVLGSQNAFLQLQADILASTEFYQTQGGGTKTGFLAAVYHDVLGRAVDPSGAAGFGAALSAGVSRTMIVKAILSSVEAEQVLVEGDYLTYLRRTAEVGGLDAFVSDLQHGAQPGDVLTAILASDEYFSHV